VHRVALGLAIEALMSVGRLHFHSITPPILRINQRTTLAMDNSMMGYFLQGAG
jgi:hypothetical protein